MKKQTIMLTFIFIVIIGLAGAGGYFVFQEADIHPLIYPGFLMVVFVISAIIFYSVLKHRNIDFKMTKHDFGHTKPFIIKIDRHGRIKNLNPTFQNGVKNSEHLRNISQFVLLDETDVFDYLNRQLSFTAIFEGLKEPLYLRFFPVKTLKGYYLIGENITHNQESVEYYRKLALENSITGLPNKNYLQVKLQELFSDRESLNKKNSLVAINVTDFKRINRLFGLKVGDATLRKLGHILKKSLSNFNAMLFNPHLDDYIVLFRGLSDYQEVINWVNQLLKIMEKPLDVLGILLTLEIKFGIFNIEPDIYPNLNPDNAIENIDLALKKAKGSRRLNYVVFDMGLGQLFTWKQVMESDLVNAIKNHELVMYYQPQVYNTYDRVYGLEALIRWNNPKYINESPVHFIKLAEENNMILEVGRFVIEETFKFAKEIEPYDVRVTINISPVQILQSGFVNDIITAFNKYQLKKNAICMEITETFLMESYDLIINKLITLKNLGISIHLDNFGTGYSSLIYLKDLPIDGISINYDFIKNLNTDRYARAIVSKLIALATSLELEVIAEGVEDQKQNKFLQENGCRIIQGHLISRAIPKSQAMKFINDYTFKIPNLNDL
jgi:diguanylate cyclase (GGDEF)-like protein